MLILKDAFDFQFCFLVLTPRKKIPAKRDSLRLIGPNSKLESSSHYGRGLSCKLHIREKPQGELTACTLFLHHESAFVQQSS